MSDGEQPVDDGRSVRLVSDTALQLRHVLSDRDFVWGAIGDDSDRPPATARVRESSSRRRPRPASAVRDVVQCSDRATVARIATRLVRLVAWHYRFEPLRRQRRNVTVAPYDDEAEYLDEISRRALELCVSIDW